MPEFWVTLTQEVAATRRIRATSAEDAHKQALEEGLPQMMFLDHTYPDDAGDWDVVEVEEVPGG